MLRQLLVVALAGATPALAEPANLEKAFGARESVTGASLSPDGRRLSFLAPGPGQGNALFAVPVDGSAKPSRVIDASGDPERIEHCGWVSNQRLLCSIVSVVATSTGPETVSRMVAVNADGSEAKLVSRKAGPDALYVSRFGGRVVDWNPGIDGSVLMGNWYVPEARIGTNVAQRLEGYGVDRVDTLTLATKRVAPPRRDAVEYISDGQGVVRIMGMGERVAEHYSTGTVRYRYRKPGGGDWQALSEHDTATREGFNPFAVDSAANVAYGFKPLDGRLALYKKSLDGSGAETLVFSRPDVDVDGLVRIGRSQRVIGVTYATERRQAHYFDPEYEKLGASLSRALPGNPLISFEGASADEQVLLIWAGGDTDPGRYYALNRKTKQMSPLLLSRPELAEVKLARVTPVSVRAADGTAVPAYLTLPASGADKGLPAIVMPHGGPGSRDEWGFDWLAQYFAARGYAVLQPNFRGSLGYGDAWYRKNGFQSWRIAIGDVADSGRWLISQGIADPKRLAILGWSYGGYAALQSGVVAPDLFKAIVAIAPVTDLAQLKMQYVDSTARREVRDFIGSGPHIREGSPAQNAEKIAAPVLLFHGALDVNVRAGATRLMQDRLKAAGKRHEAVIYPKLDHYLDDASVRAGMLAKSDAFLRAAMGMN